QVAEGAEEGQAAAFPELLVVFLALFSARLQRRREVVLEIEAGRTGARFRPQRRIVGLDLAHILVAQLLVPGRHRPGRGALEYSELRCLARNDRDRLDGRGAGADDADTQAREVDALMRPLAGVVDRPTKLRHA